MGLLALPLLFPRRKEGDGGRKVRVLAKSLRRAAKKKESDRSQLENADAPLHFRKCLQQEGGEGETDCSILLERSTESKRKRQSTRLLSGRRRNRIDPPTQQRRTAFLLHLPHDPTTYPSSLFSLSRWRREIYYSTVPIPRTTVV